MEIPKDSPEFDIVPHTRTRQAIGDRVGRSRREIPHFDLFAEADVSSLAEHRRRAKAEGGETVPTFNDLLMYIIARLLPDYPTLNAWYEPDGAKLFKEVHLGFVVHTEEGVLLPTLFNADQKDLAQISSEARELTDLARSGRLRASLQQHAGFTLSNIGPTGIDGFNAIISPPQTGILTVGSIAQRPVVVDGEVAARPTAWLVLTVDHRVVDGVVGAQFLSAVKERVESWAGEESA
jgi:pyruvate dehydrogenase E2 component (dihydrolipoamide acetyltransferase)